MLEVSTKACRAHHYSHPHMIDEFVVKQQDAGCPGFQVLWVRPYLVGLLLTVSAPPESRLCRLQPPSGRGLLVSLWKLEAGEWPGFRVAAAVDVPVHCALRVQQMNTGTKLAPPPPGPLCSPNGIAVSCGIALIES
jgi:hypothetical protein